MKMPLGTEVDLGPGHNVLNGDPAPFCKRVTPAPSLFGPISVVAMVAISAMAELLLSKHIECSIMTDKLTFYKTASERQ